MVKTYKRFSKNIKKKNQRKTKRGKQSRRKIYKKKKGGFTIFGNKTCESSGKEGTPEYLSCEWNKVKKYYAEGNGTKSEEHYNKIGFKTDWFTMMKNYPSRNYDAIDDNDLEKINENFGLNQIKRNETQSPSPTPSQSPVETLSTKKLDSLPTITKKQLEDNNNQLYKIINKLVGEEKYKSSGTFQSDATSCISNIGCSHSYFPAIHKKNPKTVITLCDDLGETAQRKQKGACSGKYSLRIQKDGFNAQGHNEPQLIKDLKELQ